MSFITVNKKQKEKSRQPMMRDVPEGHLVQTDDDVYAITMKDEKALLLSFDADDPWYELANYYLDEKVKVIGKIKEINFEIE